MNPFKSIYRHFKSKRSLSESRLGTVNIGYRTRSFLGSAYTRGNGVLKIGDICWVHPTATSQTQYKFKVEITLRYQKWVDDPADEICGSVLEPEPGKGSGFVMNEYGFNRLELCS